ncbi:S1 family peptidase, partial [Salinisphaera hydrothermalis]|uniref:S1 family peptidase n=1 Tax=Salinisphaera hydrothermalis TaxID=563188 RepID=UPI001E53DEE4
PPERRLIKSPYTRLAYSSREDSSYLFLVSNRHVFVDPDHQISLVFTKREENSGEPVLGSLTRISPFEFAGGYVAHPDPDVDLACVNISSFGTPDLGLYFRHYTYEKFFEHLPQNLSIGQEAFFIGYPENRFDVTHNLPLMRKGVIASAPNVNFNGKEEFLLDAQVFQGSSGSPVFAAVNGEHKIIGVISQTMIKNSRVEAIPVGTALGVQQVIGLGVVLKASSVKGLLDHAAHSVGFNSA